MEINQRLKAILLTAVEQPVNRPLLVNLAVILEEVLEEIITDDLPRFFPAAELQQQQEAYEVTPEMFVFASVNGDPIFLSDGVVYTYAHGCKGVPWEMLSKDLSSFFQELL